MDEQTTRCIPILDGAAMLAKLDELEARVKKLELYEDIQRKLDRITSERIEEIKRLVDALEKDQRIQQALGSWPSTKDHTITMMKVEERLACYSNAAPPMKQGVE